MIDFKYIIEAVKGIAVEAGAVILDIYNQEVPAEVVHKADNSPLTIADRKANDLICRGLQQLDLVFPIISEENKEIPYEVRKDFDYYWLVDPLDGTKEFIKRNGEFTVNIALIHQQNPILGVVYAPCLDELYWGIKGEGAFMRSQTETKRLETKSFSLEDVGLNLVCSRSHLNEATQAFVDRFSEPHLVASGSSLKFLIIANNQAQIYPRLAPTMEWDTGAAQIILEEAGGKIIDQNNQQALRYNKENLLNPHFIAYGNTDLN